MGVGLLKKCDDQVRDLDFLFLSAIGMVQGVLDHAMEGECLHRFDRIFPGNGFEVFVEEALDLYSQSLDVGPGMAQDPCAIV